MPRAFIVLVGGELAIIGIVLALFALGYTTAASLVSNVGTLVWLLGFIVFIAVWHSRTRWPDVGWFTRLSRVLTFYR